MWACVALPRTSATAHDWSLLSERGTHDCLPWQQLLPVDVRVPPLYRGRAHTQSPGTRKRSGRRVCATKLLTCTLQPPRHGDVTPAIPPANLPQ